MGKPGKSGLKRLINATGYSWQGLGYAWRNEAAFRQEMVLATLLTPCAFWLGRDAVEVAILIAACLLVIVIELMNSAIEAVVDRISDEHHELAGGAKDMASAAVFVSLALVLVVWGGVDESSPQPVGGRWDGAAWTATGTPEPAARYHHTAVALTTPAAMVVWGGQAAASGAELDSGGIYTLASDSWASMPTALSARTLHTAVSTGTTMIVWGGQVGNTRLADGGVFDPN